MKPEPNINAYWLVGICAMIGYLINGSHGAAIGALIPSLFVLFICWVPR